VSMSGGSTSSCSGGSTGTGLRLNKFVRRLHDMLLQEKDSGIVEWRKGLLVLHSTGAFAKNILPKYFNTKNFKTFRRQLNYYGFVHVRSFSTTGSTTTALWVNQELAQTGSDDIASVLLLRRVEPCETAKTVEGRRERKEQAIHTVEEDLGVNAKSLQMEQIRAMAVHGQDIMLHHHHSADADASSSGLIDPTTTAGAPPHFGGSKHPIGRTVSVETGQATPSTIVADVPYSSLLSSSSRANISALEDNADAANLLLMLSKS